MTTVNKYLDFKQAIWDLLEAEAVLDGELVNLIGKVPKLYWGRRELDDIFKIALPEIQLISVRMHTPGSISDQEPFVYPKTSSLSIRVVDCSLTGAKEAERQALDLAEKVTGVLEGAGTIEGKLRNPVVSNIDFADATEGRSFYHAVEIAYEAESLH
jgi:hypothetical protein